MVEKGKFTRQMTSHQAKKEPKKERAIKGKTPPTYNYLAFKDKVLQSI